MNYKDENTLFYSIILRYLENSPIHMPRTTRYKSVGAINCKLNIIIIDHGFIFNHIIFQCTKKNIFTSF